MMAVKSLAIRAATRAPLERLNRSAVILFYHGVAVTRTDARVQTGHVHIDDFEGHLAYLRRHHEVIPLAELVDALALGKRPGQRWAVITFDDGYQNTLTVAAPMLRAFGFPFSLFISTAHIEAGQRFPTYLAKVAFAYCDTGVFPFRSLGGSLEILSSDDRRRGFSHVMDVIKTASASRVEAALTDVRSMLPAERWKELDERFQSDQPLTWDEVAELHRQGVTIGSHCHDHAILHRNQPVAEIARQLRESKAIIARRFGACDYLAYPNGGVDDICPEAVSAVAAVGYKAALTTVPGGVGGHSLALLLPRIHANTDLPRLSFHTKYRWRFARTYRRWAETIDQGMSR